MNVQVIIVFLVSSLFFFSPLLAGSLNVGTKVIYPGGADQPPKEKDTGISFKADVTGVAREEGQAGDDETIDAETMLENGEYEELLSHLDGRNDRQSLALKSLALYYNDQVEAAVEIAKKLLADPDLPEATRKRLNEELDGELPEEETDDLEENRETD